MNDITFAKDLKKGDLCIFSGYLGKLYAGVFWGLGSGTFQFINLNQRTIEDLKVKNKPRVEYIGGAHSLRRVARLNPIELSQEEQINYSIIKTLI